MSAGKRIETAIAADPVAVTALMHRARHEMAITRDYGGAAIRDVRAMLRAGSVDASLQISHDDLEWMPKGRDVPTVGDVMRIVARRIATQAALIAGVDPESMAKLSFRLVADPMAWMDDGIALLVRARVAALMSTDAEAR